MMWKHKQMVQSLSVSYTHSDPCASPSCGFNGVGVATDHVIFTGQCRSIPFVLCFSVTRSCLTPPKHMCWSSSGWGLAMLKTGGVRLAGQGSPEDTQSWYPGSSSGISFQQRPGTNPKAGSGKYKILGFEPKNS